MYKIYLRNIEKKKKKKIYMRSRYRIDLTFDAFFILYMKNINRRIKLKLRIKFQYQIINQK